jgi:AbrB family looped-hinge helix DNA binding protein
MNAHAPSRQFTSRLTSKYQATIPKEIRQALGLKTGDLVRFVIAADGHAVIERAGDDAQFEQRRERLLSGVREARRNFAAENTLPEGMTSDQWYELMRSPPAEV